jgi:hypothetical protein
MTPLDPSQILAQQDPGLEPSPSAPETRQSPAEQVRQALTTIRLNANRLEHSNTTLASSEMRPGERQRRGGRLQNRGRPDLPTIRKEGYSALHYRDSADAIMEIPSANSNEAADATGRQDQANREQGADPRLRDLEEKLRDLLEALDAAPTAEAQSRLLQEIYQVRKEISKHRPLETGRPNRQDGRLQSSPWQNWNQGGAAGPPLPPPGMTGSPSSSPSNGAQPAASNQASSNANRSASRASAGGPVNQAGPNGQPPPAIPGPGTPAQNVLKKAEGRLIENALKAIEKELKNDEEWAIRLLKEYPERLRTASQDGGTKEAFKATIDQVHQQLLEKNEHRLDRLYGLFGRASKFEPGQKLVDNQVADSIANGIRVCHQFGDHTHHMIELAKNLAAARSNGPETPARNNGVETISAKHLRRLRAIPNAFAALAQRITVK